MGTKMKQRDVVNQKASQATLSVNERILKECHHLYTEADNGLIEVITITIHIFAIMCIIDLVIHD